MVFSDNGPKYSCLAYQEFAKEYEFKHVTSSPYYPQSNREAERAVPTIKRLLKKSKDPYRALLAYRTALLHMGYSPSELPMSRVLRSTVPTTRPQRTLQIPDLEVVRSLDHLHKAKQKQNFDARHQTRQSHRTRQLPPLESGDTVWLPERERIGTVGDEVAPQSFQVQTSEGLYCPNGHDLIRLLDSSETTPSHKTTDRLSAN